MDTRMIVFALLCVTGLVLVTGQMYDGRGGGGPGGGGGHGPSGCGAVCAISCEHGNVPDANGCPTCRCNPPPLITCPRNGKWNGIRCTPWLPNTGCELGVSCETTTSGKGICCSYPPPPISACSGNGIPIGRTCSLGRPECGPGASCETTSSGSGICCRYPLPEIQCPPGTKRTAQTCSPMSPNNNQCSIGAHDFCQGGPADGGVCCRPTVRPGTCPPPSSMAGACVIGPNQCRYDNECGVNQKCCSEGCGRVCKYVGNQYPPIPPIPTY